MPNYGRSLWLSCQFFRSIKIYFGLAERKWKQRYKKSFNQKKYSHEATLSSDVLHLKETLDVTSNLKWSVVRCSTRYSNISKKLENWLLLQIQGNANFYVNGQNYFANAVMRISTFWKTSELMTKGN